jgi:hypothetical protein
MSHPAADGRLGAFLITWEKALRCPHKPAVPNKRKRAFFDAGAVHGVARFCRQFLATEGTETSEKAP